MYLHCHSWFSLRYGIVSPADLAAWATAISQGKWKVPVCLTDINAVSGIPDFFREAGKHPQAIHPCAGIDFREQPTGGRCLYIGIACNEKGFETLNRFLSYSNLTHTPLPEHAPAMEHVLVIYPFERTMEKGFKTQLLPNEYIGIRPEHLAKLRFSPWKKQRDKLLALATSTLGKASDHHTHCLLRCIANNCLLSKLPPGEIALPTHRYKYPETILKDYQEFPDLVSNTTQLLLQCHFSLSFSGNQNKKTISGSEDADYQRLESLVQEGITYRYTQTRPDIAQRVAKEMDLIRNLGFTSYFLINQNITEYARHKGYFYVGRGSGANSLVAYCLRITDVDPLQLDLYFERFINPDRKSPPDFDLDFSWRDREDITRYIFTTYGADHTALLATYSSFKSNSMLRELGKVFGLPKEEIDRLANRAESGYAGYTEYTETTQKPVGNINLPPPDLDFKKGFNIEEAIVFYSMQLHGMPNYRSIHAGGILISEKPMYCFSALDLPPKGFPTVQWSMLEAEDLGLAKFDILSQRGLGHIKDTIQIVKQNRNEDIDIHRIQDFKDDDRVNSLLRHGRAMGCFYVESPAMRQLLLKLKCGDYMTLVAASSIIRPGVSQSGMMREYTLRHLDPERRKLANPVMLEIMPDTYGIMVYQEDVIKVAYYFAGMSLAESDVLRRGMSGKYRSREEFQQVKDRYFTLCREKGHSDALAHEVWTQIESFAGYSFAKGHSASYAVESYQSLYLKAYYPLEFYVGVINNFGGFYRTEFYVHAARMCGADIQAPCVNHSEYATTIDGHTIYLGLIHIVSLEQKLGQQIVMEREHFGPYTSLHDFTERVQPGLEQLKILVRIGAFRFTGKNRKELMWEIHWLHHEKKQVAVTEKLFRETPKKFQLPELTYDTLEDAFEQMELLGFPLCNPFTILADNKPGPHILAKHLSSLVGKRISMDGYLVTTKNTRTHKGDSMKFGTWVDREGYFFDSIHFTESDRKYPFRGRGIYRMQGMVTDDFGAISLDVQKLEKLPYLPDPKYD